MVGTRRLQPGHEPVDRDAARTQLLREDGRDRAGAGDADDGAPLTQSARRLLVDDGDPASRPVHDDVDSAERSRRLIEETLDVELIGDVGANGQRRAVRAQDLLDDRFRFVLVTEVDHDDGVTPAGELARKLVAGPQRGAGADRHRFRGSRGGRVRDHASDSDRERPPSRPGIPGIPPWPYGPPVATRQLSPREHPGSPGPLARVYV